MNNYYTLDCDDVIARLAVPLCTALNLATNKNIDWRTWKGHNLESEYNLSTDRFIDIMINSKVLEQALPIPGIKETLERMRYIGYAVNICTKRSWHPYAEEITRCWLDDFKLPYDSLNIIGLNESKPDVMKKLGSKCLIDDQIHNCQAAIDAGFRAKLIRMPWYPKATGFDTYDNLNEAIFL